MNLAALDVDGMRDWLEGNGPDARPSIPQALNALDQVPEDDRAEVARRMFEAEAGREFPRASLTGSLEEYLSEEEA